MKLSIVTTLYHSSAYIEEFCRRVSESATSLVGRDFEIILVDDGSPDDSLAVSVKLAEQDSRIKVVELSRNFGHHKAMMTGLSFASGERVFLIDVDLEEDPELLLDFYQTIDDGNYDVVYGVQETRKGGKFEQWSGHLFYTALDFLTNLKLPRNVITGRLMTHDYVQSLLLYKDQEVFMAGLWHITGYKQKAFSVVKKSSSQSTYGLRQKLSILVNSVTSFSNFPLRLIFYTGLVISLLAVLNILNLVIDRLIYEEILSGWTSIMASIWLLGGLIISFLGVIGIYLAKVFSETKDRPYTIVRKVHGSND